MKDASQTGKMKATSQTQMEAGKMKDASQTQMEAGRMKDASQTQMVDFLKPKKKTRVACWNVRTLYQTDWLRW